MPVLIRHRSFDMLSILFLIEILHVCRVLLDGEVDLTVIECHVRLQEIAQILTLDCIPLLFKDRLHTVLKQLRIRSPRLDVDDSLFVRCRLRTCRSSLEENASTALPSSSTCPRSGFSSALTMHRSVDLPAPLKPMIPKISPYGTLRLTPYSVVTSLLFTGNSL